MIGLETGTAMASIEGIFGIGMCAFPGKRSRREEGQSLTPPATPPDIKDTMAGVEELPFCTPIVGGSERPEVEESQGDNCVFIFIFLEALEALGDISTAKPFLAVG